MLQIHIGLCVFLSLSKTCAKKSYFHLLRYRFLFAPNFNGSSDWSPNKSNTQSAGSIFEVENA